MAMVARWLGRGLAAWGLLACAGLAWGQAARVADVSASAPAARPRIGLVLSGGGARGFAHVGVLRALQQLRVPVDVVVGASMGAVVGGAFAAGRSVDELETLVQRTDWAGILADRPQRAALSFRRREDDLLLPSRIEFGLTAQGVQLPPSAAGNQAVESVLRQLLPALSVETPAGRLALPYRAVATDLRTGELVELGAEPLLVSLRASLAVPGLFAPLPVNGRLLVDGGLVRNLPVDIARALGADVVIAVNVGTPVSDDGSLGSAIGVAQQMINILTEQNVQRSLRELGPADVLIAPVLDGISFVDFEAGPRAMAAGEQAARAMAARLAAMALPAAEYAATEVLRQGLQAHRPSTDRQTLATVEVTGTVRANAQALRHETGLAPGDKANVADARAAAERLYGRGDFERVDVVVRDGPAGRGIVLTPVEAEWRHSRVRVGLELNSDFRDDHRFSVAALHVLSWLNPWGGELRSLARLGSTRHLGTEWWQPLGPGSPWFGALALAHESDAVDAYDQRRKALRLGIASNTATATLGRQLGRWGEVTLGLSRQHFRGSVLLPEPAEAGSRTSSQGSRFVQLALDTLEPLAFPTRGALLQARYERATERDADGRVLAQSSVQAMLPFRLGPWGGHLYGEWAKGRDGFSPLPLGGFLRLSGTARNSINGSTVLFGRAVLGHEVGRMPAGLGGVVRVGVSAELGAAVEDARAVHASDLLRAGSAFVSVDTRFGPLYLAAGATRLGGNTVYLFLGPFW